MQGAWYYIYVLYSQKDYKLYIGYTKDIEKRVRDHNDGLNTSTAPRRPLILIFAEAFISEKDARKREKFYKSGRGREVLKKKLSYTFGKLENNRL